MHPGVTDKGNYTMFDMVRPLVPVNGPPLYPPVDYRSPYEKPVPVSIIYPACFCVWTVVKLEHCEQPVLFPCVQFLRSQASFNLTHIICGIVLMCVVILRFGMEITVTNQT